MAYTIIEVERKTGVSSRTLRFWLSKGLFPFVESDENGVRYFSENDIEWVQWIDCYRKSGMSIAMLKVYINLCAKGIATLDEREALINSHRQKVIKDIQSLQENLKKLDYKMQYFAELRKKHKDELNPQSKDYQKLSDLRASKKSYEEWKKKV